MLIHTTRFLTQLVVLLMGRVELVQEVLNSVGVVSDLLFVNDFDVRKLIGSIKQLLLLADGRFLFSKLGLEGLDLGVFLSDLVFEGLKGEE